jgi:hypothetical protein
MAVQLTLRGEARGRVIDRSAADDNPWDRAVALILGPRLPSDDPERRRADALALSAAAMKAAEDINLSNQK